jgi:hypothetical protein
VGAAGVCPPPTTNHPPQIKICWFQAVFLRQKAGAPTAAQLQPSLSTLLTVGDWERVWCAQAVSGVCTQLIACAQVLAVCLLQVSKPLLHTDCAHGRWRRLAVSPGGLLKRQQQHALSWLFQPSLAHCYTVVRKDAVIRHELMLLQSSTLENRPGSAAGSIHPTPPWPTAGLSFKNWVQGFGATKRPQVIEE